MACYKFGYRIYALKLTYLESSTDKRYNLAYVGWWYHTNTIFVQLDKQQIENSQRCMFHIIAFLLVLALGLLVIEFVITNDELNSDRPLRHHDSRPHCQHHRGHIADEWNPHRHRSD